MGEHPAETFAFEPGDGLVVTSKDGAFELATRVRGQVRHTTRFVPDTATDQAFRLRRARIVFAGHFFGKQNRFKLELAVAPADLGLDDNFADDPIDTLPRRSPMLDLYFEFRQLRDLSLRIGQYKLPSNRQRVISSGDLQLVDRSLLNGEFTLDRDVAFDLRSKDLFGLDLLRYYAGIGIGRGRDSQGFDDFHMTYFARVEVLPFGMFEDYAEADFERSTDPRLSIGAVYVFLDHARGQQQVIRRAPADGGSTSNHLIIADAIFKIAGFSAMTELAWRKGTRHPGDAVDDAGMPIPTTPPRDGWGAMIQAGYLLPGLPLEFAARYGRVAGVSDTSLEDSNELGGGLSWYFAQHPFKLQADLFRLWDDDFGDGSVRVRVQLQAGI